MTMATPDRFARLCAVIEYPQQQVVDTLVTDFTMDADDARVIVERAYAHHAAAEADFAANEHMRMKYPTNDGGTSHREE